MNKKKKNRGFSLIEIIVTIAIMAVITAGAVSIYSLINSSKLKSMAGKVNDAISNVRSDTLTKEGVYGYLMKYDNTEKCCTICLYKDGNTANPYKKISLGKSGRYYVKDKSGNTYYLDKNDTNDLNLEFDKSDGSFKLIKSTSSGTAIDMDNYIYVEYAGKVKKIKLVKLTGKHYIE